MSLLINSTLFHKNLRTTQAYCHSQLGQKEKSIAEILRSYNPIIDGISTVEKKKRIALFFQHTVALPNKKPLFSFEQQYLIPNIAYSPIWSIDPLIDNNIRDLFKEQLTSKQQNTNTIDNNSYTGAILVCHIDQSVIDGASEVESLGFIDINDLPPIDTWFYLMTHKNENILFAWIPADFMRFANDGILVNCIECFTWFQDQYPDTYKELGLEDLVL